MYLKLFLEIGSRFRMLWHDITAGIAGNEILKLLLPCPWSVIFFAGGGAGGSWGRVSISHRQRGTSGRWGDRGCFQERGGRRWRRSNPRSIPKRLSPVLSWTPSPRHPVHFLGRLIAAGVHSTSLSWAAWAARCGLQVHQPMKTIVISRAPNARSNRRSWSPNPRLCFLPKCLCWFLFLVRC